MGHGDGDDALHTRSLLPHALEFAMTSLGSIALKVLDAPLASGAPVLAKRKSVVAKVDDAKREEKEAAELALRVCLLYTSPSPRDGLLSRMPSSA